MVVGGENLIAFISRFVRTWISRCPSTTSSDGAPGSTSVSTRAPSSPSPWHASVSRLFVFTGCGMNVSLPASIREMSSRSSTRRISRSVWTWMIVRYSCTSSTESSACRRRSASTNPRTAVSGVRSSWLVMATKSDFSSSSSRSRMSISSCLARSRAACTTSETWSARRPSWSSRSRSIDPASLPALVQDADHGVPGTQRHHGFRGILLQARARELGPGRERFAPRHEPRAAPVPRVAVDARRDELLRAVGRLQEQHAERVALHLASDRLGDLLDPLRGILRGHPRQDRRVERGQVAASLGFALGGVLGALGGFLGRGRPLGGELGFLAERAREHAGDQRDDRRHPHAERHGRTDEVIARELLRQVHLPGDLRDEQDRERRERPQDPVPHRPFDRQEVRHHPCRVGRFGRRDPHPLQDHDRVQEERHGSHPVQVRGPSGLLRRTA